MNRFLLAVFLCVTSMPVSAQKVSVSTNILGYVALGTMNADISYAISRHYSVVAGVRYNPFTFKAGDTQGQFQCRQQSYSLGVRMWPWHIWSGWWFSSKIRYQEYNMGGVWRRETTEGDRVGAGLYAGYSYMLSKHFNLDFGLGVWGGYDRYRRYSCPSCGLTVDEGGMVFFLPDDMMISLVYVF